MKQTKTNHRSQLTRHRRRPPRRCTPPMQADPHPFTPIRNLFKKTVYKCFLHQEEHIRIAYYQFYILDSDTNRQYEEVGRYISRPCNCNTDLPFVYTASVYSPYPPKVVPPRGFLPPVALYWVRIQNSINTCRLVRRPDQSGLFDHVVLTIVSTYLVRNSEIENALHLKQDRTDSCVCPPDFASQFEEEVIQAPAQLSFTSTVFAARPEANRT